VDRWVREGFFCRINWIGKTEEGLGLRKRGCFR
jgi:hypothetical protein